MNTKPTPSPSPQSAPKTTWEFTDGFDVSVEPPAIGGRAPRADQLPFASKFFEPAMKVALEGKKPHKFIAKSFFQDRAEKPEKVDGAFMKGKVRDQFNKWKKKQSEDVQKRLQLISTERSGKEGIEGIDVPGLSVWIITSEPVKSA